MIRLKRRRDEETVLGYDEIEVLENLGPFEGGGDCLVVRADGEIMVVNSNDVVSELKSYEISSTQV